MATVKEGLWINDELKGAWGWGVSGHFPFHHRPRGDHGLTSLLSASVSSSVCRSGVIHLKCFDIQMQAIDFYLLIYSTQDFII